MYTGVLVSADEKNEQLRQTYELKAKEYMNRAEELKEALDDGSNPDSGGAGDGSAVAKGGQKQDDGDQEKKKLQGALQGEFLSS